MDWQIQIPKWGTELGLCSTKELFDAKIAEIENKIHFECPPAGFWAQIRSAYERSPKRRQRMDSVNATALFDLDAYINQLLAARLAQGQ